MLRFCLGEGCWMFVRTQRRLTITKFGISGTSYIIIGIYVYLRPGIRIFIYRKPYTKNRNSFPSRAPGFTLCFCRRPSMCFSVQYSACDCLNAQRFIFFFIQPVLRLVCTLFVLYGFKSLDSSEDNFVHLCQRIDVRVLKISKSEGHDYRQKIKRNLEKVRQHKILFRETVTLPNRLNFYHQNKLLEFRVTQT